MFNSSVKVNNEHFIKNVPQALKTLNIYSKLNKKKQ